MFNFEGLIPLLAGIYALFLVNKRIEKNSKETQWELWHKKYGKIIKILAPILILFGVVQLLGLL